MSDNIDRQDQDEEVGLHAQEIVGSGNVIVDLSDLPIIELLFADTKE